MTTPEQPPARLEIERKFLLHALPPIPPGAEIWRIEQGYLPPSSSDAQSLSDAMPFGRLRRVTTPDGSIACTHTIKQGIGMVRTELEREIAPEAFERHWPRTLGCRLRKTRHRVHESEAIWEIDVFDELDLVLAEIELPRADAAVNIPAWLKPFIVREVTNEAAYTNSSIAAQISAVAR